MLLSRIPCKQSKLQMMNSTLKLILHSGQKKKGIGGHKPGKFALRVRAAVDHIIDNLRGRNDYNPLFLTDEEMGIDKYSEDLDENFLISAGRAQYRDRFWKELKARVERMCIHVFGKDNASNEPDCIFVWKVPAIQGK